MESEIYRQQLLFALWLWWLCCQTSFYFFLVPLIAYSGFEVSYMSQLHGFMADSLKDWKAQHGLNCCWIISRPHNDQERKHFKCFQLSRGFRGLKLETIDKTSKEMTVYTSFCRMWKTMPKDRFACILWNAVSYAFTFSKFDTPRVYGSIMLLCQRPSIISNTEKLFLMWKNFLEVLVTLGNLRWKVWKSDLQDYYRTFLRCI